MGVSAPVIEEGGGAVVDQGSEGGWGKEGIPEELGQEAGTVDEG